MSANGMLHNEASNFVKKLSACLAIGIKWQHSMLDLSGLACYVQSFISLLLSLQGLDKLENCTWIRCPLCVL